MKVLTVVGNRPQFIKAAPLSLALAAAGIREVSVHSGQHYDQAMSEVFYNELGLHEPTHSLDLRTPELDVLERGIGQVLLLEQPDWLIVFGDTNTTLAGARAGGKAGVALAHIEAGLRSGDLAMPEERNRIEVDRIADVLFCPDEHSRAILDAEGVVGAATVVGDIMADAVRIFVPLARERFSTTRPPGTYALVTVHREANVGETRLRRIVEGLNRLREPVVFPAHPRTQRALFRFGLNLLPHISIVPPLGYFELSALASQARVILTDSGGLQKEAYWYGVPCITLRPSTEWVDTVRVGANVLVDDDPDAIAVAVETTQFPPNPPRLYGDGHAAERVVQTLLEKPLQ